MKWMQALKQWNSAKGGSWCVPRKGTAEHAEVKAIMASDKPASEPVKKVIRRKKAEEPKEEPKEEPVKKVIRRKKVVEPVKEEVKEEVKVEVPKVSEEEIESLRKKNISKKIKKILTKLLKEKKASKAEKAKAEEAKKGKPASSAVPLKKLVATDKIFRETIEELRRPLRLSNKTKIEEVKGDIRDYVESKYGFEPSDQFLVDAEDYIEQSPSFNKLLSSDKKFVKLMETYGRMKLSKRKDKKQKLKDAEEDINQHVIEKYGYYPAGEFVDDILEYSVEEDYD